MAISEVDGDTVRNLIDKRMREKLTKNGLAQSILANVVGTQTWEVILIMVKACAAQYQVEAVLTHEDEELSEDGCKMIRLVSASLAHAVEMCFGKSLGPLMWIAAGEVATELCELAAAADEAGLAAIDRARAH